MTTRRRELDLTLGDVASAIGVSPMDVSGWALGETVPDPERLVALAKVFQVPADDLASMAGVELDGAPRPEPAVNLMPEPEEPGVVEIPTAAAEPAGEEPAQPEPAVNVTPEADEPGVEIPTDEIEPNAAATPFGEESSDVWEPAGDEPAQPESAVSLTPEADEPDVEIPTDEIEPNAGAFPVEVEPVEVSDLASEELTEPTGDDLVGDHSSVEQPVETDAEPGVALQVADVPDGADMPDDGSSAEAVIPTPVPEGAPNIPAPLAPAAVMSGPAPARPDDPPSFVTPEGRAEQLSNVPLGYVQDSRMMLRYRLRWALTTVVLVIMFFIGLWASRELIDALSLVFEAVTP